MIDRIRNLRSVAWMAAVAAALAAIPVSIARAGIGDIDSNGWTELSPSNDSIVVYVSSSTGSDSNNGLSPSTPKQTIDAANALVRDGYPDWILLKRGDTFPQPNLGRWKSGRSASEPMVLGYYGDTGARPIIKLNDYLVWWNGQARQNVAFIGLDLYRSISDPDSADFTNTSCDAAFGFIPGSNNVSNILVEDCRLRFCWIVCEGSFQSTSYMVHNANFRRNIIVYNWHHGSDIDVSGRIQGMYIANVDGIVIEENLFYHNGWSEVISDAPAAQFSHNIYMGENNDGTILVRGNVLARAAAHGLQLRSGGTAEMNAFINNSIGMNVGYSVAPTRYTGNTYVRDNVVTDGKPQVPNDTSYPQTGAIWGIWKETISNVSIDDNIVANILDTRGGNMRPFNNMTANQYGSGNIAWNWVQNNEPATDPGWTDPDRNEASFATSLGYSTFEDWINDGIDRPVGTMPFDLTAYKYVDYIREGFDKADVTPPYTYDGSSGGGGGGSGGSGSETFTNLTASTTNQSSYGSYTGDNGETWTYFNVLKIASGITGVTPQVRKLNGYIETTLPDGVDDLSFTIQTEPGKNVSTAQIQVVVGGVSQGTFSPTATDTPYTVSITGLGESGPVTLRFNSLGNNHVWIDDISWTTP